MHKPCLPKTRARGPQDLARQAKNLNAAEGSVVDLPSPRAGATFQTPATLGPVKNCINRAAP